MHRRPRRRLAAAVSERTGLSLRLCVRGGVATATLGHELVELGLVLGSTQAIQKFLEFALFILKSTQRLRSIFVESPISTRSPINRATPPTCTLFRILPPGARASMPTSHALAPYQVGQDRQTNRPVHKEAENHQRNPGWPADLIQCRRDVHEC